jgi:hypothetical protein
MARRPSELVVGFVSPWMIGEPAASANKYFRSVGLRGPFWAL